MAPKSTERTVDFDHGKAVLCSNIHQRAPMKWNKKHVDNLKKQASKKQALERFNLMSVNEIAEKIKTQDDFLRSEEWFILKAATIAKYGCKCMKCKKTIKQWSDINVDHIKPRKFFPDLRNDPDNLQILCGKCNKAKGNSTADYR